VATIAQLKRITSPRDTILSCAGTYSVSRLTGCIDGAHAALNELAGQMQPELGPESDLRRQLPV